ncbi:MAG TPA: cupin domain-containing protein [Xanthobacteraceae bacterium]|nr:cupin domain-containing protein [Xanthobacteraceae bacterium]
MTRIGTVIGALALMMLPLSTFAADEPLVAGPDSLTWGPGPAVLPKGAELAVIAGDPGKEGPFVFRIRVPAGYMVQPHTHPVDENVTVISGTFNIAMGDKFDQSKGTAVKAGGFLKNPSGMAHYAWFTEPTVFQVHGVGPWGVSYVNPADDPRKSN